MKALGMKADKWPAPLPPLMSLGQCVPAVTTFLQHNNTGCSVPLLPLLIKIHLSTLDFLTATPMALLKSFKHTTPPGSIANDPPTPPLTADAKISGRVAAILRVFEVSCSQKRKSLINLAENYLLASDGGIRVMFGIDLEYKKSKEASISI